MALAVTPTQTLGILGGTFDPVHNAHLAIAHLALQQLGAEKILWIPTGSPGYRAAPVASGNDRVAMLRLALAAEPRFVIDERELKPGASGYTVDTLASLQKDFPRTPLVLLMGADQYEKRGGWRRWQDLAKACRIAVVARPDFPKPEGDVIHVTLPPSSISASDIRARIGRGEDVSAMVPASVLEYIGTHRLYR